MGIGKHFLLLITRMRHNAHFARKALKYPTLADIAVSGLTIEYG
jgi:hypothetical protein